MNDFVEWGPKLLCRGFWNVLFFVALFILLLML